MMKWICSAALPQNIMRSAATSVYIAFGKWLKQLTLAAAILTAPLLDTSADEPPIGVTGQGAFSSRYDFTELRGLPPRPASSVFTVADLGKILSPRFLFLQLALARYGNNGKIRLLESYTRTAPTYLKARSVYIPNADGVIQPLASGISGETLSSGNCNALSGTHTCADIYKPALEQQEYDIVFIVGWDVELAGDVYTAGQSVVIVANRFRANGFTINTTPMGYEAAEPPIEQPGSTAANGRSAPFSGQLLIYASEVTGVHASTDGMPGEDGLPGKNAVGVITETKIVNNHSMGPVIQCKAHVVQKAQAGGDGGDGGAGGAVMVRYSVLRGLEPRRQPSTTKPITDRECVGKCGTSFACSQNPSIAICGAAREADNETCADSIDNDNDKLIDCEDYNCSKNPYVTVCKAQPAILESSPEACSDGIDNDGNGHIDCSDPKCALRQICGAPSGEPFVVTTGSEEASTATCSDAIDNDLDGKVDCADLECQFNPFVTDCGGSERTLEVCSDDKDNDGDGLVDCNDSGCKDNPYVLICESSKYPFLEESTTASCSDDKDNDGDHFVDCKDYQCLNNPLASPVCGNFENTLQACIDKKDNDGDYRVDCDDPNCSFNPFFGEMICDNQTKTKHKALKSAQAIYNGAYKESEASFSVVGASAGNAGKSGDPLEGVASAHYYDAECFPCLDEECLYCTDTTQTLYCQEGGASATSKAGKAGAPGSVFVRWMRRVDIEVLRALLSPRQWVVGMAQANALFKRSKQDDVEEAGFLYVVDLLRMLEVMNDWSLGCAVSSEAATDPNNLAPTPATILQSTICPIALSNLVHLQHMIHGRNFYGYGANEPVNPNERYNVQHDAFIELYGMLDSAVANWIQLANGVDISFQVAESKQEFEELSATLSVETDLAVMRENAALLQLSTLEDKLNQRELALKKIDTAIASNNVTIKEKYKPEDGGLGKFIVDLVTAIAEQYGASVLKEIGEEEWEGINQIFENATASKGGVAGGGVLGAAKSGVKNDDSQKALDDIWEFVKRHGETALKSSPVEDAAKAAGTGLQDFALGKGITNPVRSVIVDEVANEILASDQRQLILDHLDLKIDTRKAKVDYEIAKMERALAEMRLSLAMATVSRIEDYMLNTAELRAYDKVLLGQQVYGSALTLVEDLTQRYWKLLHQAEYEKLPYTQTGTSELTTAVGTDFDFNLKNYDNLGGTVVKVNQLLQKIPRGASTLVYRRITGTVFEPATDSDKARFNATGLVDVPPFDAGSGAHVASILITNSDVDADLVLRTKRNIRIDDVRVNIISSNGTITAPPVFLLRDGLDVFRVRRQQNKNYFREYDLVTQDLTDTGSSISPVHYQSFSACLDKPPACTLLDNSCVTAFQNQLMNNFTCGLYGKTPGATPWKENTFYDRSLVGRWTLVVPDDVYVNMGTVSAVEVSFVVAALTL